MYTFRAVGLDDPQGSGGADAVVQALDAQRTRDGSAAAMRLGHR
ncbi:MAG: hypothetical protein ACT452_06280 [Microthrixaceae bacterium]